MISPVFIAHGSPMMAIEDTAASEFLKELGKELQPKAIVVFTAHWESRQQLISSPSGRFATIHDFGGFPPELHAMEYPAQGAPELAARIAALFREAGIAVQESARGLDHGAWVPLSRMFPEADIPVVQLSVNPDASVSEQIRIGEALRELAQEDILIMGSGVTVHNLWRIEWDKPRDREPERWATDFDDWLIERLEAKKWDDLEDYARLAPRAKEAVPTPEHFVPLLIAAGSGDPSRQVKILHRSYEFGVLSYLSLQF